MFFSSNLTNKETFSIKENKTLITIYWNIVKDDIFNNFFKETETMREYQSFFKTKYPNWIYLNFKTSIKNKNDLKKYLDAINNSIYYYLFSPWHFNTEKHQMDYCLSYFDDLIINKNFTKNELKFVKIYIKKRFDFEFALTINEEQKELKDKFENIKSEFDYKIKEIFYEIENFFHYLKDNEIHYHDNSFKGHRTAEVAILKIKDLYIKLLNTVLTYFIENLETPEETPEQKYLNNLLESEWIDLNLSEEKLKDKYYELNYEIQKLKYSAPLSITPNPVKEPSEKYKLKDFLGNEIQEITDETFSVSDNINDEILKFKHLNKHKYSEEDIKKDNFIWKINSFNKKLMELKEKSLNLKNKIFSNLKDYYKNK